MLGNANVYNLILLIYRTTPNHRLGHNPPWRGRQTLCQQHQPAIIESDQLQRIRHADSVDEFHRLLQNASPHRRNPCDADTPNPISAAAAGGLIAPYSTPERPKSAHPRRAAAHPSQRVHAIGVAADCDEDSVSCCDSSDDHDDDDDADDKHLDWYTRLASRCHRDGFQWHVDYLLEKIAANRTGTPLTRRPLQRLVDQHRHAQHHRRQHTSTPLPPPSPSSAQSAPNCTPSNNASIGSSKCVTIILSGREPFKLATSAKLVEHLCRSPYRCEPQRYDTETDTGPCTMSVVSPSDVTNGHHIRDIGIGTPNHNNNIHVDDATATAAATTNDIASQLRSDSPLSSLADAICALSVEHHQHDHQRQRRRDATDGTYLLPQITLTDCSSGEQVPLPPTPTASPTHASAPYSFISGQ